MQNSIIRDAMDADYVGIYQIITNAFKDDPHSNNQEANIVENLRKDNALTVSLVAEINKVVVGHIAFSKVTINNTFDHWYGLAPVSIDPQYQNQGFGGQLIKQGLMRLKSLSAHGCVVLGEPGYYGRFGFESNPELILPGVPSHYFQALSFNGKMPNGEVKYHDAFA